MIESMLKEDPLKRPTASHALSVFYERMKSDKEEGNNPTGGGDLYSRLSIEDSKMTPSKTNSNRNSFENFANLDKKAENSEPTLPQEYQAEIDSIISTELIEIEEKYPFDMYLNGNRY